MAKRLTQEDDKEQSYMFAPDAALDSTLVEKTYGIESKKMWQPSIKKKGIELRDAKQGKFSKNDFIRRESLLDLSSDSVVGIRNSPLKGIYMMIIITQVIYSLNFIVRNYLEKGLDISKWFNKFDIYDKPHEVAVTLQYWAVFIICSHIRESLQPHGVYHRCQTY